ncbi:MAG: proteasome assembly chaperone family protein [Methanotrichaceae archaeon]|nr:proteasome assembly chaperone family protein [Methanotrichaceae archaeon]
MDKDIIQVVLEKEPSIDNPVLIEGFPGIGLVGNIASQYIVHERKMTYLGAMNSKFFPPLAVLLGGVVNMPVRIYEDPSKGLVVLTADIPIHPLASYDIGKEIVSWAESINVKEMVCLAGITVMGEQRRVFAAASQKELLDKIKDGTEIFEIGTITGITGSIMNECRIRNLPAICLLGETASAEPDPRAAIATVETLNKIYKLEVDTKKLEEQAEQIELQMSQLAQLMKAATPTPEEQMPGEFPMYV